MDDRDVNPGVSRSEEPGTDGRCAELTAVLEALQAHIAVLDEEGLIRWVNRSWLRFGRANGLQWPDGGVGRSYLEATDAAARGGDDLAAAAAVGIRDLLTGRLERLEMIYPCHTSSQRRWFLLLGSSFTVEGRRRAVLAHEDISRQVQAQEELLLTQSAVEGSINAIAFADVEGRLLWVNRSFLRMWGFGSQGEVVGRPVHEFWRDRAAVQGVVEALMRDGSWEGEGIGRRPDRRELIVQVTAGLVRDHAGEPVRMMGVFLDVTERRTAQRALAASEERHRIISEITSDYVYAGRIEAGGHAHLEWVSGAFHRITGYTADEVNLLPGGWLDLIEPSDRELVLAEKHDTGRRDRAQRLEYRIRRRDGEVRWLRDDARVLECGSDGATRLLGSVQEVTALRRAEEALEDVARAMSGAIGKSFFETVVRHMTSALGAAYAFVGELSFEPEPHVTTIAVCADGEIVGDFTYWLADTPCREVSTTGSCVFERGVQQSFPDDLLLAQLEAESYVGVPLRSTRGDPLGLIVVLDRLPLGDRAELAKAQLEIVAGRAAAELERMRAEAALRVSEEHSRAQTEFLSTVIESLTHPFMVIAADDFSVRLANAAAVNGWALCPSKCYQLSHGREAPCDGSEHPCPLVEVQRTGRPTRVEHQHRDGAGRVRHVEIHGYPIVDENGRVTQMIEYALDVTDRKVAEDQLRRRNRELTLLNWVMAAAASDQPAEDVLDIACRELASLLDAPQASALLVDRDRRTAAVAAEHRRSDRRSAVGRHLRIEEHPSFADVLERRLPLVTADSTRDPRFASVADLVEFRRTRAMLVLPLVVATEVVGALVVEDENRRDFSDDEVGLAMTIAGQIAGSLARARLDETRRRLQTAIEQTADSVVVTDVNGDIVYANPAFLEVEGLSLEAALGRTPEVLDPDAQETSSETALWPAIAGGREWRGRHQGRRADGRRFVEDVVVTPVRDSEGGISNFVIVSRDISRLLELEESYQQAQKMESIGRLAGGVAHDFNNLLAAIMGYAEISLARLSPDHPLRDDLREIVSTSERAASLTQQLLAFARRQVAEPRPLDAGDVLAGVENMLRRLIGEDIELETHHEPGLWRTEVDPHQLQQVILNLVVNARDAMPAGGRLSVGVANTTLEERWLHPIGEVPAGDYVHLTVTDTGDGIAPENLPHIFEPFFTTKGRTGGTGLGLATCFGIVSQSGGSIAVDSAPGDGATFHVFLPRCDRDRIESGPHLALDIPGGDETILLVEDEPSLRELLARVLAEKGYRVMPAADGAEALEMAERDPETIDMVVTDVVMPRLGGRELVDRLRGLKPNLAVLFISGYPGESWDEDDEPTPGEVLPKPFSPAVLAIRIREILDR